MSPKGYYKFENEMGICSTFNQNTFTPTPSLLTIDMSAAKDASRRGLELRAVERCVDWGMAIKSLGRGPTAGDSKQFSKYFDGQWRVYLGTGDPDEDYKVGSIDEGWQNYKIAAKAVGVSAADIGARSSTYNGFKQDNGVTTAMRCLTGAVCSILPQCQEWLAQGAPHSVLDDIDVEDAPSRRKHHSSAEESESSPSTSGYTVDRKGKGPAKARTKRRRIVSSDEEYESPVESSDELSYRSKSKHGRKM